MNDVEVAELGRAGVATVYEACGRRGLLELDLLAARPGARVAGPARTALCGQDDNRAVHEVLSHAQPGDVLVLTMPRPAPVALVGDLIATQAAAVGVVGILVDAAVRDSADLVVSGPPVWSRWRRATGARKSIRGEIDVPVIVGGVHISPRDVVVLDDDGGVVVPGDAVVAAAEAVRLRVEKEALLRARWRAGELSYDAYGLRAEDEGTQR